MATPTYTPIASITLGSSASSVTFSSIPQDYRDLVLKVTCTNATGGGGNILPVAVLNSDTGSNYSRVRMTGDGSSTASGSSTGDNFLNLFSGVDANETDEGLYLANFMDYSATDKHKTVIARANQVTDRVGAIASRWADTSAITQIEMTTASAGDDFASGSTFALYGIEA